MHLVDATTIKSARTVAEAITHTSRSDFNAYMATARTTQTPEDAWSDSDADIHLQLPRKRGGG